MSLKALGSSRSAWLSLFASVSTTRGDLPVLLALVDHINATLTYFVKQQRSAACEGPAALQLHHQKPAGIEQQFNTNTSRSSCDSSLLCGASCRHSQSIGIPAVSSSSLLPSPQRQQHRWCSMQGVTSSRYFSSAKRHWELSGHEGEQSQRSSTSSSSSSSHSNGAKRSRPGRQSAPPESHQTAGGTAHQSFAELGLPKQLLAGLEGMQVRHATPVQMAAMQPILQGRNVAVQSPTGTGKTLAYLLPVLAKLRPWGEKPRQGAKAVVICPTQDLCMQVLHVARNLLPKHKDSAHALVGGPNIIKQLQALRRHKPALLVASPGRLVKAVGLGSNLVPIAPNAPRPVLVIEEADKLMAMSDFRDVVDELCRVWGLKKGLWRAATVPASGDDEPAASEGPSAMQLVLQHCQVILVSSSMKPSTLRAIPAWTKTNPVLITAPETLVDADVPSAVAANGSTTGTADSSNSSSSSSSSSDQSDSQELVQMLPHSLAHQVLGYQESRGVHRELHRLLKAYLAQDKKVLVFVGARNNVSTVQQKLAEHGLKVSSLSGEMSSVERRDTLRAFNSGRQCVLLVSDAFGLGLDFKSVDVVVQVESLAASIKQYVHRAGRTGRMGQPGTVITVIPQELIQAHQRQLRRIKLQPQEVELVQAPGKGGQYGIVPRHIADPQPSIVLQQMLDNSTV